MIKMLEQFRYALREVYSTQKKVIIFMDFLKASIFFLILYGITSLFNFYRIVALLLAIFYFINQVYRDLTNISLRGIERKNPFLDEILRTAADTVNIDENPIVEALREQVLNGIRMVKLSSFINADKLTGYLLILCVLASMNIIIGVLGLQIMDVRAFIENVDFDIRDKLLGGDISSSLLDAGVRVEDINEDNELYDINEQFKRRDTLNIEELPEDIFKSGEKGLDELFSKKKRIYIRNYFNKLR